MFLEHMRKENAIEVAKKNHTPNWVSASDLFSAISSALAEEIEDVITADKLIGKAYMSSD